MISNNFTFVQLTVFLSAVWLSTGCAHHAQSNAYANPHEEVSKMRQEQKEMNTRVNDLEHQIMVLKEQIRQYEQSLTQAHVSKIQNQQEKAPQPRVHHVEPEPPPKMYRIHGKKPAEKVTASTSYRELKKQYDTMFERFNDGDCQDVILDFDRFAKNNPDSSLADNALYWIGECFYRMKEYRLAIEEYEKVPKLYPEGNKVPDSFLRIGMSFAELGDTDKARKQFLELITQFPGTNPAEKAKNHLDAMGVHVNANLNRASKQGGS